MRGLFDIYRAHFKTTAATQLQYRMALVIWLIGMILEPVIYLVVWTTISRTNGGDVQGFTSGDFAAYFITTMMVNHLTFTWVMFEFEYRIRSGQLTPKLLRPVHPVHGDVADNLTYKTLTLTVMIPAATLLALSFNANFQVQWWSVLAFIPVLLLAIAMRFVLEWSLALVAFWTTRTGAVNQMYFVTALFLSGQVAPLALLPAPVQALSSLLPFRWFLSFPVELLLGRVAAQDVPLGMAAQAGWLVAGLFVLRIVWRAAVRQYTGVGI